MQKFFFILCLGLISSSLWAISHPFRSGQSGDLTWSLRLNLPICDHEGKKQGAWCKASDAKESAKKSGVEEHLRNWMNDKKVKSIYTAYYSFSNATVRQDLCKSAKSGKKVFTYINISNAEELRKYASKCNSQDGNGFWKVYGRAVGFKKGSLQHAKIFFASELENLSPLAELKGSLLKKAHKMTAYFTSSSANMSVYGTSLHLENWLFFESPMNSYLSQQNVCVFKAFATGKEGKDSRTLFAKTYDKCVANIAAEKRDDVDFYMLPSSPFSFNYGSASTPDNEKYENIKKKCASDKYRLKKPFCAMFTMVDKAQKEVLVGIHRLMTERIYLDAWLTPLSKKENVKLRIILDDDTLRTSVVDGGATFDVAPSDVYAYRTLRQQPNVELAFMETNAESTIHLFHSKYLVVDGKEVFQGAGNFTASALNITSKGNYEQFYWIRIPEIAAAYSDAWKEHYHLATWVENHPVGGHLDANCTKKNDEGRSFCDKTEPYKYRSAPYYRKPTDYLQ